VTLNLENNTFTKTFFTVNRVTGEAVLLKVVLFVCQECETKIAQEIASLSKEDVSKEEMNENEEVINILLAQVDGTYLFVCWCSLVPHLSEMQSALLCLLMQWEREGLNGSLCPLKDKALTVSRVRTEC